MKSKNTPFYFTADCNIQAAKGEDNDAPPTFDMVGYKGGKMSVFPVGDVAIDLDGLKASKKTPILYGHQGREIETLLGQTTNIENDKEQLSASGNITGDSDTVQQVMTHAKNGYTFQASVGLQPKKTRAVPEDETVDVNGQELDGPLTLISKSKLREISVLPMGADDSTSVNIAAEYNTENEKKEEDMKNGKEKDGKLSAEEIREQRMEALAEENRIMKIEEVADGFDKIKATAIEEGLTPDATENRVMKARLEKIEADKKADKESEDRPGKNISFTGSAQPKLDETVIEAAAAQSTGLDNIEDAYSSDALNKASDLKLRSITDLVSHAMALEGKKLECTRHDVKEFLTAAFSSTAISNILSNLTNKYILEGFGGVESTWRKIANTRSLVDFKPATGSRLVMSDLLKELGDGGEIQHGSLSDEARTVQADTRALMINITRKEIINDDLGALTDVPNRFGFAAARTLNADFWAAFETFVEGADFSDVIGNQASGTTPLTIANLKTIEQHFLELKDADGNYIGVDPATLLVAPKNAAAAREINVSTRLNNGSDSNNPADNIYAGQFEPAVSRYLTTTPWYLAADPQALPAMTVGFLNGREEPFVESADADFNQLGMKMRCYFDYGVGEGNSKALVRAYNS